MGGEFKISKLPPPLPSHAVIRETSMVCRRAPWNPPGETLFRAICNTYHQIVSPCEASVQFTFPPLIMIFFLADLQFAEWAEVFYPRQ